MDRTHSPSKQLAEYAGLRKRQESQASRIRYTENSRIVFVHSLYAIRRTLGDAVRYIEEKVDSKIAEIFARILEGWILVTEEEISWAVLKIEGEIHCLVLDTRTDFSVIYGANAKDFSPEAFREFLAGIQDKIQKTSPVFPQLMDQ